MTALYRIYDTVEKRHRNDLFVTTEGIICRMIPTVSVVEDQERYIVERCTGLYDKNKVLVYENDITQYVKKKGFQIYHVTRYPINVVTFTEGCFELSYKDEHSIYIGGESINVIGHKYKDSHLLTNQQE